MPGSLVVEAVDPEDEADPPAAGLLLALTSPFRPLELVEAPPPPTLPPTEGADLSLVTVFFKALPC